MSLKVNSKQPEALVIVKRMEGVNVSTLDIVGSFTSLGIAVVEDMMRKSEKWSQEDWCFNMTQNKLDSLGVLSATIRVCEFDLQVIECPSVIVSVEGDANVKEYSAPELIEAIDSLEDRVVKICEAGSVSGLDSNSARFYCAPADLDFLLSIDPFSCKGCSVSITAHHPAVVGGAVIHCVRVCAEDGGTVISAEKLQRALKASYVLTVELLVPASSAGGLESVVGQTVFHCSAEDAAKLGDVTRLRACGRSFIFSTETVQSNATQLPVAEAFFEPMHHPVLASAKLLPSTGSSFAPVAPCPPSPASVSADMSSKISSQMSTEKASSVSANQKSVSTEKASSVSTSDVNYHIELFHDAENCWCPPRKGLQAPLVKEYALRAVLAAFLGNERLAESVNLAHVNAHWNFVLHHDPANNFHPDVSFVDNMRTCGAIIIDPGTKPDAVDTQIKSLLTYYASSLRTRPVVDSEREKHICVIISSDKDYSAEVRGMGVDRITTVIVHNQNDPKTGKFTTNSAFISLVPPGFALGIWEEIIAASSNGAPASLRVITSGKNPQRSTTPSRANRVQFGLVAASPAAAEGMGATAAKAEANSPLRGKGSSLSTAEDCALVSALLASHVLACGGVIEACKLNKFYKNTDNKSHIEAAGGIKAVCAQSGGQLSWIKSEESVGFGFIIAASEGVAVVPMPRNAYNFLRIHFKSRMELEVEAVASGCSVEFIRSGACNIRLCGADSVATLRAAKGCVLRFVGAVHTKVTGFSGVSAVELQRNRQLENLKESSKVTVFISNTAAADSAPTADAVVHELEMSVSRSLLHPSKGVPVVAGHVVSQAAVNYAMRHFREKFGVVLASDRIAVTSVKPLWVNLKVAMPDESVKSRALAMQTETLKIRDVVPQVIATTELETATCTFLYLADDAGSSADTEGLRAVEQFIAGMCNVVRSFCIKGFHHFLFVRETLEHLQTLVASEVQGVVLSVGEFDKVTTSALISICGVSKHVDEAAAILAEKLNLLVTDCPMSSAVLNSNDNLEAILRCELGGLLVKGNGVNQQNVGTVRFYFNKSSNNTLKSVKVLAYEQAHALWQSCVTAAKDLGASCRTVRVKLPAKSNVDIQKLKREFGVYIPLPVGPELVLTGAMEKVQAAEAHISQLLSGLMLATKHLSFAGENRLLIAQYFALPVLRTVVSSICAATKKSYPSVSLSVFKPSGTAVNSSNILILHGKSADITAACEFAMGLLQQQTHKLLKKCIELPSHEIAWLAENRANVADDLAVVVDMEHRRATSVDVAENFKAMKAVALSPLVTHSSQMDGVIVSVAKCDFSLAATDLQCDCIVNSANPTLSNGAGIAKAIADNGGPEFFQACQSVLTRSDMNSVPVGTAVTTLAFGQLRADGFTHVVHLVSPKLSGATAATIEERKLMRSAVRSALTEASNAGVSRVALPGIGTGLYLWSVQESTTLVVQAVSEWVCANPASSVRDVVVFDVSDDVVADFAAALEALEAADLLPRPPVQQLSMGSVPKRVLPAAPVLPLQQIVWEVDQWEITNAMKPFLQHLNGRVWMPYDIEQLEQLLEAFSTNQSTCTLTGDVAGAQNGNHYRVEFGSMTQNNTTTKHKRNVLLLSMDPRKPPPLYAERVAHFQQLLADISAPEEVVHPRALCRAYSADSPVSSPVQSPDVLLFGTADAVAAAETALLAALSSGAKCDVVNLSSLIALTKVTFAQVTADIEALLQDSNVEICARDESAFTLILQGLGALSLSQAMTAVMTHMANRISDYHKVQFPTGWTNTASEATPVLVALDPTSAEYAAASSVFLTDFKANILRVERVENPALYSHFYFKCREIADRNDGNANVQLLKHGTQNNNPSLVWTSGATTNTYGFDHRFSYASTYDQMYGKGNYFAEDTAYSHNYRFTLPSGESQMFLASVAMGRVQQKASPHREQYRKIVNADPTFQSVRGVISSLHQGIITYELHQTYPAYLVTYRV